MGGARLAAVVAAASVLLLGGCGAPAPGPVGGAAGLSVTPAPATPDPTPAPTAPPTPVPLFDPSLPITSGPVAVPLRFRAPSVGIDLPVLGVGITKQRAMDAPEGPPNDPVWHEAFWYRAGSDPGMPGTATIAGHLDDTLGRPGGFWNIRNLRPGDIVEVLDVRTGAVSRFRIDETHTYSLAQANDPAVMTRLYGDAAVTGDPSLRNTAPDGVARLSLVTCTGVWQKNAGEYNSRFLAFASALPSPAPAPVPREDAGHID